MFKSLQISAHGGRGKRSKSVRSCSSCSSQILRELVQMTLIKDLTGLYYTKIIKSLKYFEFSYARVSKLNTNPNQLTDQEFETWDGFATRFSRTSDLFLSKFIKAAVLKDDPGFDGNFRDYLNRAEKLKLIDGTSDWLEIRSLRNVIVHDYSEDDLEIILKKMLTLSPLILNLRTKLLP